MKPEYCFFEDELLENFHPLTLTRPIWDLRVGIFTLAEKWMHAMGIPDASAKGILREHQQGVFERFILNDTHSSVLWLNPRIIPSIKLAAQIKKLKVNEGLTIDKQLIAAHISNDIHQKWEVYRFNLKDLKSREVEKNDITTLSNSWELFQLNGKQIVHDIELIDTQPLINPGRYPHTILINTEQIFVEEEAVIEPGAIITAVKGPVYVGKGAQIMANSVVRGPAAICEKSVIKMGAKIYEDTTIGPVCKVGGEVANVIFHSYSNKAHDGYAGNSVFGQWCNLGADTNTSNLKNNYSTVKVIDWKTKKALDTGQLFIGTIMGDHSKTGINAMLNTGTLCGVCCNLFSDDYPPKFVPSFSWVSGSDIVPYHFEKAAEAMERMMNRRNVPLTPAYHRMMKAIFRATSF